MSRLSRRAILAGGLAAAFAVLPGGARAWTEPKRGSGERKAILDAIRPAIEAKMRGPVEFVVRAMRVERGWAFLILDPQRPGGRPIDPAETAFAADAEFMDGLTVYALMRLANGRWNAVEHVVGPTDVPFEPWPGLYGAPRGIFGF